MNKELLHIILASTISADNNYDVESCKKNLDLLSKTWDKLDENEQEQYCEQFNMIKEVITKNLKEFKKN